MENIEITTGDVLIFKAENKMLYASDSQREKRLYITLGGNYEVWHKGVKKVEGMNIKLAVSYYNNL